MTTEEPQMNYLSKLFGLEGRVAVVTGGASGLGAAFSNGLAEAGATIVVADINESGGAETVRPPATGCA